MANVKLTKSDRYPSAKQRNRLWEESGLQAEYPDLYMVKDLQEAMRKRAERSLYWFAKWVLGFRDLAPLHEEMSLWLTDFRKSRRKLMLIPVGHLKTTLVSKSMPLHILIQPSISDIYFPRTYSGRRGQNARLVLGAENKDKAAENLSVMAENLMTNGFLAWLWPHCVWDGPNDPRVWSAHELEIPRTEIDSEPSIMALGAETPIVGKHFDGIFPDDLATTKAALSMKSMQRAKTWLDRSWSRLHDPYDSLHIGAGTHQNSDDIYIDWRKMPSVESVVRSIEEPDAEGVLQPLWPERYDTEKIAKMRADTDAITWALFYMNQPVSSQWTAMQWSELREFRWVNGAGWGFEMPGGLEFSDDAEKDKDITNRIEAMKNPLARFANGLPSHQTLNREQTIKRMFGSGMSDEQRSFLKDKYGEKSPAQTDAKEHLERMLGSRR